MLLIGVTGQKRSGKGEVAGFVKDWAYSQRLTAEERGFSDLLKWSAYRLFKPDCTMREGIEWCNELKEKGSVASYGLTDNWKLPVSGREFLQSYGTEAHREVFGKDFWVDSLLPLDDPDKLRSNFKNATIGVISDLRFDNEAERIKELGGAIWNVERQLEIHDAHVSEQGIDPSLIDYRLDNSGGLTELRLKVEDAVGGLLEDHKLQLRMQV